MPKEPLDWYKEQLKNSRRTLQEKREERARVIANFDDDIERATISNNWLEKQIAEAERRGMDGFDRDRFLKPKDSRG